MKYCHGQRNLQNLIPLKIRLNEYDTSPKGINDIWDRTQEIWYDNITVGEYQKVIQSMPNCVKVCIKAKGYGIDH